MVAEANRIELAKTSEIDNSFGDDLRCRIIPVQAERSQHSVQRACKNFDLFRSEPKRTHLYPLLSRLMERLLPRSTKNG